MTAAGVTPAKAGGMTDVGVGSGDLLGDWRISGGDMPLMPASAEAPNDGEGEEDGAEKK